MAKSEKKRNCDVCGGLLDSIGNCTKCAMKEAERMRAEELCRCKKELAELKKKKAEERFTLKVKEGYFHDLTFENVQRKVKALADLGVIYIEVS